MVKHQRRSHQRGMNPNDTYDDISDDSESGDSPSTPKHTGMHWPQQVMTHHPGAMAHGADMGITLNTPGLKAQ